MRGRRFLADVADAALTLPWALVVAQPVFSALAWPSMLPDGLEDRLSDRWGPLLSVRLLVTALAVAWAMVFVLVRIGQDTSAGEGLLGLAGPPQTPAWKRWVRALFVFDLPLGWVLPERPVDLWLKTARTRDRSRTALEALGATHRRRPALLVTFGFGIALALGGVPLWKSKLESHHRMLLGNMVATWGSGCPDTLLAPTDRQWVAAARWARWLAPEAWDSKAPPGTGERAALEVAAALLDGPCARLRPGDPAPEGRPSTVDARNRPVLLAHSADNFYSPCMYRWRGGNSGSEEACGALRILGNDYAAESTSGRVAECGVYARGGRIAAVVGFCGR